MKIIKNVPRLSKSLCLVCLLIFFLQTDLVWSVQIVSIQAEWEYTPSPGKELAGFRLYKDNQRACQIQNSDARSMNCQVEVKPRKVSFTITAYFSDGLESNHSAPFVVDFSKKTRAIPKIDLRLSVVDTLPVTIGTTTIEMPVSEYNDAQQAEIILNWLEPLFPEILSPSARPTQFLDGIYYRSYLNTNVMTGTFMGDLYFLDHLEQLYNLGGVNEWLEHVPDEIVSFEYACAPLSDRMGIDQALEIQKRLIHASILYKEAMIWTGEALWADPADISHFQWNNVTLEAISLLELAEKSSALLYASAGSFSPQLSILAEQMAVDVRKANYLLGMVQSMIDHQTWSDQRQVSNILEQAALSLKQACRVTLVSGAAVMTGGNSATLVKVAKAGASAVQGVDLVVEIGQNASRLAFGEDDNLTVLLENSSNIIGPPEKFISVSRLVTDPVDDDNLIYSGKRLIDIIYGSGSKSMVRTSEGYNGLDISNPIMEMYADRYDDLAFVLEDYLNEQEYELFEIIKGLAEKIDHANAYEIPMSTRPLEKADLTVLARIKTILSGYDIDPDDYFNSFHEEMDFWLEPEF